MKRLLAVLLAALLSATILTVAGPASAQPFPDVIDLPVGFSPEGVAIDDRVAYFGSLADGSIQRADLKTGEVTELAPSPGPGRIAVGMDIDRFGRLWVAGGGSAFFPGVIAGYRVYDTDGGTLLADVTLGAAFVNDVIVTDDAAWFTDTFQSVLFRVPIGADGSIGAAEAVTLGGDWEPGPGLNANGIVATADGKHLIVAQVQAPDGSGAALYVVPADDEAAAVEATRIDLDGALATADGLVLIGRTLYVVGPDPGVIEIKLGPGLDRGRVFSEIAVPAESPTTADVFGSTLYVVDADFPNIFQPVPFKAVAVRR